MYNYTRVQIYAVMHSIDSSLTNLEEYKWCVDTFKLPTELREWYVNERWNQIEFNFRDPAHALMFSLRWT